MIRLCVQSISAQELQGPICYQGWDCLLVSPCFPVVVVGVQSPSPLAAARTDTTRSCLPCQEREK
jgi:hypothetical protein